MNVGDIKYEGTQEEEFVKCGVNSPVQIGGNRGGRGGGGCLRIMVYTESGF